MRRCMMIICMFALTSIFLASNVSAQSVSLDHVDGLVVPDVIQSGSPITFHIRMTAGGVYPWQGIANGFRVYSPQDAEWTTTVGDTTGTLTGEDFDLLWLINNYSVTGSGADTVAIIGAIQYNNLGMPLEYDDIPFTITIGPIGPAHADDTICIDSAFFFPAGVWKWATGDIPGGIIPAWSGPHCFVVAGCCVRRGDIDNDGDGPDIEDLVYLVTFMFSYGPVPECIEHCDIDGNGGDLNIADLVYLVNYMFNGGPPPVPCP